MTTPEEIKRLVLELDNRPGAWDRSKRQAIFAAIDRQAKAVEALAELLAARAAWIQACIDLGECDEAMPVRNALGSHKAVKDRLDAAWEAARAALDAARGKDQQSGDRAESKQ